MRRATGSRYARSGYRLRRSRLDHQAMLRDLETVALLSVNGSVHIATGERSLVEAFEETGRSIAAMTAALLRGYLP